MTGAQPREDDQQDRRSSHRLGNSRSAPQSLAFCRCNKSEADFGLASFRLTSIWSNNQVHDASAHHQRVAAPLLCEPS